MAQGGTLVRGERVAREAWYAPALLASVPAIADVAVDDEIFGPVVTTIPFDDDEESIRIVNGSQLALTAAVFSADLERALAAAERFQVGGVVVNGTNNYRPPAGPLRRCGDGRDGP